MAAGPIILDKAWGAGRPCGIPKLNRTNPLTKDIAMGVIATQDNQYYEFVQKIPAKSWTVAGSGPLGPEFATTDNIRFDLAVTSDSIYNSYTFLYKSNGGVVGSEYIYMLDGNSGNGDRIVIASGPPTAWVSVMVRQQTTVFTNPGLDVADGALYIITVTTESNDAGSEQRCYINGLLRQTNGSALTGTSTTHTELFWGSTIVDSSGTIGWAPFAMWHKRILSAGEVAVLHRNPWQIFAPSRIDLAGPPEHDVVVF